jgi:hypothetical protein
MKRHGPGRHIQDCTNFLHYFAFGEQLQNFPLSVGELVFLLDQFARLLPEVGEFVPGTSR